MEDRRASLLAASLGIAAVGCFWLARPLPHTTALPVLSQKIAAPRDDGPDRDAAMIFQIGECKAAREGAEDGKLVEYRLQGSEGQSYRLAAMEGRTIGAFKLQKGYPKGIHHPKLAMLLDERPVAWANVDDVPEPREEDLRATSDAPFRLLDRGGRGVRVEPKRPLGPGERWRITARRTTYASVVEAEASFPTRQMGPNQNELTLPFPEATRAVEVDLDRERMQKSEETVRIPNLRLVEMFGGAGLAVDKDCRIRSRLGATILLPHQLNGPRHVPRRRSPSVGEVNLLVSPPPSYRNASASKDDHRSALGYRLEILSPSPESLGLLNLRIGAGGRQAASKPGPLRTGSFTATTRITYFKFVPIERRRLVVAVEKAPPLLPGQGRQPS